VTDGALVFIDGNEGEKIDEALNALIRAAVTLNASRAHG
jgi:hypothetical protein